MNIMLPVPPSINKRYISRSFVVSKEYREFKTRVAILCRKAKMKPLPKGTDLEITLVWHQCKSRGDIDSRIKPVLDALNGYAYEDDSQISFLSIWKSKGKFDGVEVILSIKEYL